MNLSVKNMIFAFVAGLIVFSLLMTAICVAMFNSEIDVAKEQTVDETTSEDTFKLSRAMIFTVEKSDGLSFAVLAMVDNSAKEILLTPVYGDYLVPYKNALSFVSNIYSEMGSEMLTEMVKAFSGLLIEKDDVYKFEGVVNYDGFKNAVSSKITQITANDVSKYEIVDFNLVLKENKSDNALDNIKQIDVEKNVEKFRNILD